MHQVPGMSHLYKRGGSYVVRLQVPLPLRGRVGRTEFRRSLGGDFRQAKALYHQTVAEFRRLIDAAQTTELSPSEDAIDEVVQQFHRDISDRLRGSMFPDDSGDDAALDARLARVQTMISIHAHMVAAGYAGTMRREAAQLAEQQGWSVSGPEFQSLCQKLLRARLDFLRAEEHRLLALHSERANADPLFQANASRREAFSQRTVGDLLEVYWREKEAGWSRSTRKNYVVTLRAVEELLGRSTQLVAIDRNACRRVRDVLSSLPPNYRKRADTRTLSIQQAADWARRNGIAPVQPATLNAYLTKLFAVFQYAVVEGWIAANPAARLTVPDPVQPHEKRDPFTRAQLQTIFASDPWLPRDDRPGERPARFWVPLLALFTGARAGELCQLRVSDLEEHTSGLILNVRGQLKNDQSFRRIAVHPELIRIGFHEFWCSVRVAGHERLFPEEKADGLNQWSRSTSRWFSRHLRGLQMTDGRRLGLHSFRHNWEDALRDCDLTGTSMGLYLSGRSGGGSERSYGRGFSSDKLIEAVGRVQYPGLDLSHLHVAEIAPLATDPAAR